MELVNDFVVNVPIDEAWVTLTDVERIAPCLPGAQLEEIEGDVYRGKVKIKVGPILAQFKGQATFIEKDDVAHKAVLKAEGRETAGKGNASALITAMLSSQGADNTKVTVTTDLTITGKVAQFGRGALADVSTKLLGQFVEQLEATVLNQAEVAEEAKQSVEKLGAHGSLRHHTPEADAALHASDETAAAVEGEAPKVRKIDAPEAEPVDLLDAAGAPIAKRLLPVIVGIVVLWLVVRTLRRRRSAD
ncbi:MAG TPA: SRPBCC family protein [Acidimicrobiales bacterium]